MTKKTGLEIKKAMIKALKTKECSLRALDTKLNTNYQTIRTHVKELEFLHVVEVRKHARSPITGRPYTTVRLTPYGRTIKIE